jgi:hypothetical protein
MDNDLVFRHCWLQHSDFYLVCIMLDIEDCFYIQVFHLGAFATFEVVPEINGNNFFVAQI